MPNCVDVKLTQYLDQTFWCVSAVHKICICYIYFLVSYMLVILKHSTIQTVTVFVNFFLFIEGRNYTRPKLNLIYSPNVNLVFAKLIPTALKVIQILNMWGEFLDSFRTQSKCLSSSETNSTLGLVGLKIYNTLDIVLYY